MRQRSTNSRKARHTLPVLAAAGLLSLGLPSASLAFVSMADGFNGEGVGIPIFTPASVDPQLAQRLVDRDGQDGMRFTPAEKTRLTDRAVTVAVRIDSDTARAISLRRAIDSVPGAGEGISAIAPTRYNLGTARGYQSFARQAAALPTNVRDISMPDLGDFRLSESGAADKPSRFSARIALDGNGKAGRSEGTREALGNQSVDLGGAYTITRNLDVTAGVRLSQERDRLAPLTDSAQDSQAVYVGTQFRF